VLNIITVHWRSPKWIAPQLDYLEHNLDVPYRIFASLNGIDDPALWQRFHYAADLEGTHAEKLNALARVAIDQSDPGDQLLFLDGDAFPVRPIGSWVTSTLQSVPLAAVRRDENLGDHQPHPCFCFTTCQFWKSVDGDWREGGTWVNSVGDLTTDVGGNLLHQLEEHHIDWLPLLRSNTRNPDPLWFGVYGHRIYHHGAGFRDRASRLTYHARDESRRQMPARRGGRSLEGWVIQVAHRPDLLLRVRPRHVRKLGSAIAVSLAKQERNHRDRAEARAARRADAYEQQVYQRLLTDPGFYRTFDAVEP
jgi:hypothetical protein